VTTHTYLLTVPEWGAWKRNERMDRAEILERAEREARRKGCDWFEVIAAGVHRRHRVRPADWREGLPVSRATS